MDQDTKYEAVLDGLYEAALNPDRWPRTLHDLLRWAGADAIMLLSGSGAQCQLLHACGHSPEFVERYRTEWLQQDPRLHAAGNGKNHTQAPPVADDVPARFRNLEREHGLQASFADHLELGDGAPHWVLLSLREQAVQARVAIRYGRLRQHLERALRLARRQAGDARNGPALAELADDMPLGMLLLGRDGCVQHSNLAGHRVLVAADSLKLQDGRLRALRESDDKRLREALRAAMQPDEHGACVTQWLSLPRRSGEAAYTVSVREAAGGACLRVLIGDAARVPEVGTHALGRLFELTARESQVCERLLRGLSIEDTAADLGVSPRTARVYLQQVFLKLGVHRQADLVRLLMSSPAMLGQRPPGEPADTPPAKPTASRRQSRGAEQTRHAAAGDVQRTSPQTSL